MGIFKDMIDRLNNGKYQKLKQKYIEEYKESGYLGSIEDIQEYISKKNINVMSKSEKYGDDYDVIEEIFSNNPEILAKVQAERGQAILRDSISLNSRMMRETLEQGQTAVDTDSYKKFEQRVLNFDDYYNQGKHNKIEDNRDKTLEKIERVYNVIDKLNADDRVAANEFSTVAIQLIKGYSMNKLMQLDNISQQQDMFLETQEALERISKDENFVEFARSCNIDKIDSFFDRIESVSKLQELGIDCSIENSSISYIDASNEQKKKQFYQNITAKKKEMKVSDFDVSSFAMVRTTPYFPINKEMEVIDELNCRTYISNFLSGNLKQKELKEKFGENWFDEVFGNQDEESRKAKIAEKEKIEQQYETLSPMYRSTKHFTLNGLVSSHEYGDFSGNPYIFIEPLEEHINDEGILSLNEADTYFKISREKPFKLSDRAKLMMPLEEYLKIKDNPEELEKIHDYDLTLFSGDEKTAVDMKLAEMGYMPEDIGKWGYELESVMDYAISKLSKEYEIEVAVHYYSDISAEDQQKTNEMTQESNLKFVDKIFEEFGIDENYREGAIGQSLTEQEIDQIISFCGEDNLKSFISKFNEDRRKELDLKKDEFYAKREKEKSIVEK